MRRSRGLWLNWLLVILAIGSVGLVFLSERSPTTMQLMAREQNLLKAFRKDEITRIIFERNPGSFTLERAVSKGGPIAGFRISTPFQEEAAPEVVDAFLGTLEFATFVRRVADTAIDRAGFGLDAPKLVVHVEMGDVHYRLRLGNTSPSSSKSSYLEVSGEGAPAKGVFVVSQALIDEIDVGVDKFRGRQLIPYGKEATASLKLMNGGSSLELKSTEGRFRLMGAANVWVDRDREERLFLQLARLKVERFLPLDTAEAALKQAPPLRVEITPSAGDSPKAVIEFGGDCAADPSLVVALRREPGVLAGCVPKAITSDLEVGASDLVDLNLFSLRFDEIAGLEIANGDQKLKLTRAKEDFQMVLPESANVEREVAEERLKGLLALHGKLVAQSPAALGLDKQGITVVLHGSEGEGQVRDEAVSLAFSDKDAALFAWRHGDDAVLEIERVDPALFDASTLLLKSRQIFELQAREIQKIEIDTADVKQTIVQSESGLHLESPSGFALDSGLGLALLDTVRNLRANRWVATSDTGHFGLSDPQGEVKITVKKKDEPTASHRLLLGANTKGGVFAQVDGGGVFVLSTSVVEAFRTWALDRAVFLPLLGDVTRIRLRASSATLELEKSAAGFRQVGGSRQLTNGEIQQLLDELGVIRAEATVHLGAALPHEGFARPTLELSTEAVTAQQSVKWMIGVADAWRDVAVYYGRVVGKDATFVVPRHHIQRILDAL